MVTKAKQAVAPAPAKGDEKAEMVQKVQELEQAYTLDKDTFDNECKELQEKSESLVKKVQSLALSAILDCAKRKQADRLNQLIKTLPDGFRKNSLREWFNKFGSCRYDKETKQFVYDKSKKLDLWNASKKSWATLAPEKEFKPFNLFEEIQKVLKRAQSALESGREVAEGLDQVSVNQLSTLAYNFKAETLLRVQNEAVEKEEQAQAA